MKQSKMTIIGMVVAVMAMVAVATAAEAGPRKPTTLIGISEAEKIVRAWYQAQNPNADSKDGDAEAAAFGSLAGKESVVSVASVLSFLSHQRRVLPQGVSAGDNPDLGSYQGMEWQPGDGNHQGGGAKIQGGSVLDGFKSDTGEDGEKIPDYFSHRGTPGGSGGGDGDLEGGKGPNVMGHAIKGGVQGSGQGSVGGGSDLEGTKGPSVIGAGLKGGSGGDSGGQFEGTKGPNVIGAGLHGRTTGTSDDDGRSGSSKGPFNPNIRAKETDEGSDGGSAGGSSDKGGTTIKGGSGDGGTGGDSGGEGEEKPVENGKGLVGGNGGGGGGGGGEDDGVYDESRVTMIVVTDSGSNGGPSGDYIFYIHHDAGGRVTGTSMEFQPTEPPHPDQRSGPQ